MELNSFLRLASQPKLFNLVGGLEPASKFSMGLTLSSRPLLCHILL